MGAIFESEVVGLHAGCQLRQHLSAACQAHVLLAFTQSFWHFDCGCFAAELGHLRLASPRYFFYTLHEDTVFLFMPIPEIPKKAPLIACMLGGVIQRNRRDVALQSLAPANQVRRIWPNADFPKVLVPVDTATSVPRLPRIEEWYDVIHNNYVVKLMRKRPGLLRETRAGHGRKPPVARCL